MYIGLSNLYAVSSFPNNSIIARRKGALNVHIDCAIFSTDGSQLVTTWNLRKNSGPTLEPRFFLRMITEVRYEGTPRPFSEGTMMASTYHDHIVIMEYPNVLHGYTLSCGVGGYRGDLYLHRYFLKVYRR